MEEVYNTITHHERTYQNPRPVAIQNTIDDLKAIVQSCTIRPSTPPVVIHPYVPPHVFISNDTMFAAQTLLRIHLS